MAAVIHFPSPLAGPVIQHPRRGRLPKAIGSLRQVAARRMAEAQEAQAKESRETAEYVCRVRSSLYEIAKQATPNKLTGIVVIASASDGKRRAWVGGQAADDYKRAALMLLQTVSRLT